MKLWFVKSAFIILVVFLLLRFGPSFPITSTVTQKQDFFTVTGEGRVTVIPDTAIANLGITVTKPNVRSAQTEANNIINKISADLKNLGVGDKDIKTSNYSIYPQYNSHDYTVNINLTVTVHDFDKINQVLDTATTDGANSIGNINLTINDQKQKELVKQARQLAITEAKDKAQSLSSAAGMTLGKIINIQESSPIFPRPFMQLEKASIVGDTQTQIQSGTTDITSTVTLFFETR